MQLFVHCEIIHIQDFFAELEVLFGSHKPLILSVGRGQVKSNKLNDFDWPTAKLTAEWAPLDHLMRLLQVKTGVNTLVGTPNPTWCHDKL